MTLCPADPEFVDQLRQVLPPNTLRDPGPSYLEEPRGQWQGQAGVVACPARVEEVQTIMQQAAKARVPIVPYGGGTGLVGGQLSPDGPLPVVLSLERMNSIRSIEPQENVVIAEAGVILSDLHEAAEQVSRLFALSIASKGSARVGGLLATNAGGVNVLRYGNARDLCLGLEAVMPDGQIWHGLKRLRKDNTGYDLRNLLIGSEGTLGVITAASLKLFPIPSGVGTAVMAVPTPEAALQLLSLARDHMGDGISAFELIHRMGLDFLTETMPDVRQPFDDVPEWFVLIDVGLPQGLDPETALETLFAAGFEAGLVSDGLIAQNERQRNEFWNVRETIPAANRLIGAINSHDVSLPLGAVPEFIRKGDAAIAKIGDFRINCFGHLGDGNLHYNVFPPKGRRKGEFSNLREEIKTTVHDLVHALDGSFSAELGVGSMKTTDLERYGDPTKLSVMRAIKTTLDPHGIMNPGAVLARD